MPRHDPEPLWLALLSMQRHPWEQAVASHAALDAGRDHLALMLAHDAVVRQDERGRLADTGDIGLVNSGACGEAVAALAAAGDVAAVEALERQRWWLLRDSPRADSGVLFHLGDRDEVWADTVYMVVPFLVVTGDVAPADMQYRKHREHLWNPDTGLYGHKYNPVTHEAVRSVPWATGNGWVAAALARALHVGGETIPAEMSDRWRRQAGELLSACAPLARDDGRFHDVLDEPTTFVDGTAGLMLAYAAYVGVTDGWLGPEWAERADRWCDGALAHVDEFGLVREVCGAPHFNTQGTSAEAQAFALMALSARARVSRG